MVDIVIPATSMAAHGIELVANSLQAVKFDGGTPVVEVLVTDSTADVFWSPDGRRDITPGSPDALLLPTGIGAVLDRRRGSGDTGTGTTVTLITTGTATVSVQKGGTL